MAKAMISEHPKTEMGERFEKGQLPCSFGYGWTDVLLKLEQIERDHDHLKQRVIVEELAKEEEASQEINALQVMIQGLKDQIAKRLEDTQEHKNRARDHQSKLDEWEKRELDVHTLQEFALAADENEKKLLIQLKTLISEGCSGRVDNCRPKLGLLLNCFGADEKTIEALEELSCANLLQLSEDEVSFYLEELSRPQQIIVLYAQERLQFGRLPFAEHDCALCNAQTPKEMACLLEEVGIGKAEATEEAIRLTGASGTGALLFLSPKDLKLGPEDHKKLIKFRNTHRDLE